ncbi:hypothetical protein BK661_14770 [Pseudomonas frederiksbergensis]|uniref:Uncharacterized protein n=1 Tax=Pseudomonas frederiksbergensis TaxID=104087 RepID=A0A423J535_9PSED|nr:hypothetical protein BK661_14770 [Pseudomonas frederiksbergensis]
MWDSDGIKTTRSVAYVDTRLRKQSCNLAAMMGLMVKKMHDQAVKILIGHYTLHVYLIEGAI